MMKKEPFFIVGVGRSGTTLLRMMMHNHPNIAVPYESHFVTDYFRNKDAYGDLANAENRHRLLDDILNEELLKSWDHKFDAERVFCAIEENTLSAVFDAVFQDYALAKGKSRWGDKSDYLDRMHLIKRVFPEAKFIHIIRDGRDVANSVMKMSWGPKDIIQAAEWWHEHVRLGRAMGSMLDDEHYIEVRYEDLVNESERELRRLCDFIDEPFSEEMLNYHKKAAVAIPDGRKAQHYNNDAPPKSSRTFAWKNEMSAINVALFGAYAKNSLQAMDYELPNTGVTQLKLKLAKACVYFKRLM